MPGTEKKTPLNLTPGENQDSHGLGLQKPSTILRQDVLASDGLISSTARLLHSQMSGMFSDSPPKDIMLHDPEKVKVSCQCAQQIVNLLKLKVDAVKAINELMKNNI